jgi:hypothetical protein
METRRTFSFCHYSRRRPLYPVRDLTAKSGVFPGDDDFTLPRLRIIDIFIREES